MGRRPIASKSKAQTYKPSRRRRSRRHGFRARMNSKGGKKVLKRRRRKGRQKLTP